MKLFIQANIRHKVTGNIVARSNAVLQGQISESFISDVQNIFITNYVGSVSKDELHVEVSVLVPLSNESAGDKEKRYEMALQAILATTGSGIAYQIAEAALK